MGGISDFLFGEDPVPGRIEDTRSPGEIQQHADTLEFVGDAIGDHGFNTSGISYTAPLSNLETDLLADLDGTRNNPAIAGARDVIANISGGTGSGTKRFVAGDSGIGTERFLSTQPGTALFEGDGSGTEVQGPSAFTSAVSPILGAFGDRPDQTQLIFDQIFELLSGESQLADNPILQKAIDAATRPIREQFEDELALSRSNFNQAGQFTQPDSSSPFEFAKGKLQTGLANALGDVGADLSFKNLTQERDRQSNLLKTVLDQFESQEDRVLFGKELELQGFDAAQNRLGFAEDRELRAFDSQQDRLGTAELREQTAFDAEQKRLQFAEERRQAAFDAEQTRLGLAENRQLDAATSTASFESQQITDIIAQLDAAALPRYSEQYGLVEGQRRFDERNAQLMQLLELALASTAPQNVSIPGSPGGGGIIGPVLSAAGTAFGGPIGGAAATAVLNI